MARRWRVASTVAIVAAIVLPILVRGSRDWLQAPYGFDVLVLVLVVGAAIVVFSRPHTVNG